MIRTAWQAKEEDTHDDDPLPIRKRQCRRDTTLFVSYASYPPTKPLFVTNAPDITGTKSLTMTVTSCSSPGSNAKSQQHHVPKDFSAN